MFNLIVEKHASVFNQFLVDQLCLKTQKGMNPSMLTLNYISNIICSSEYENLTIDRFIDEMCDEINDAAEEHMQVLNVIKPSYFDEEFMEKIKEKKLLSTAAFISVNFGNSVDLVTKLLYTMYSEFKISQEKRDQEKMELLTSFAIDVLTKTYKEMLDLVKDLYDINKYETMYEPEEWSEKKIILAGLLEDDQKAFINLLPRADQFRDFLEEVADCLFEINGADTRIIRTKGEINKKSPLLYYRLDKIVEDLSFYKKYLFVIFRKSTFYLFFERLEKFKETFDMKKDGKEFTTMMEKIKITLEIIKKGIENANMQYDEKKIEEIARRHFPMISLAENFIQRDLSQ